MNTKQDGQTSEQLEASLNGEEGTSQQTLESSTSEQSVQVEDANLIPEKFVGKSAYEISQAYRELEKERGRMANELGSARKEREEMENRFKSLEQAVSRYNTMPTQTPPQVQQQEQDPLSAFDEVFDEDPKKAIKEALRLQHDQMRKQNQEQSYQQRAQEAQQYYWSQKKDNSDYARREPIMQQLVSEFQDVIRPEYLNSKKVLEALDLMSRGKDLDFYTKQAVASVQKNGSSVREEKRRAQSESSSSDGDQLKEFSKLSSKEMEKLLRNSDE